MSRRLFPISLIAAAAAALWHVAVLVSRQTIDIVRSGPWLPRWDLAGHLVHGWTDYFYLKTLQIHRLLWDLWLQGYWPPGHSIFQMPFYLAMGGEMTSGLVSSLAAFVLVGVAGTAVLYLQWRQAALLPAALFLVFLITSPFYLAYASVAMTEMLGALAHMCVLLCYLRYDQTRSPSAARWFAISLTALFFTKYNYFILLVVPLLVHEYLRRTDGRPVSERIGLLWQWTRRRLSTPIGAIVGIYLVAMLAVTLTGGFQFSLAGQRVSFRTVGNSAYLILYLLLGRLWYLHWRGRIDWPRLFAMDPRVRPLLFWFVVPVVVWFASPFPNHMKDFANLVINRPMGEPSASVGLSSYLNALGSAYFHNTWLMAVAGAGFAVAAFRYRRQSSLMQWLIIAAPLEFAMVAGHQTRFVRFLLLTLLPLWLVACGEIGHWVSRSRVSRWIAGLAAPLVLAYGLVTAREIVQTEPFLGVAFNNYVHSEALKVALASVREGIRDDDTIAVQGESEELSPSLFRWQLGPPSGGKRFPLEVRLDTLDRLDEATQVVLIVPLSEQAPPDLASRYPAHAAALQSRVDRGEFAPSREVPVPDLSLTFRLYKRTRSAK